MGESGALAGAEGSRGEGGSLRGLLDLGAGGATAAASDEIPPRVIAISVFALAVAVLAALFRPDSGATYAGFLWILALIPAFLLSYYHGWTGAVRALAGGMALLTLTEVVAGFVLQGDVDWWIYGGATTVLIAVSLGSGMMAELFHRTGGGPGVATLENARRRDLQRAVEEGQLVLHFQPVVSLDDREAVGVEALVRWEHPRRGLLKAGEFVSFAETAGLLVPVSNWAMEEAFRQFGRWRARFPGSHDFFVAVNLSTGQCRQRGFVEKVRSLLEEHDMEGENLQVEVSEETLDEAGTQLSQIRGLGAALAVDDFGTGYVSIGQLARLELDAVKIDSSFVARMRDAEADRATVEAIVTMSDALGLQATAEAVESREQYEMIRDMGCDLGQGSFFAEPFPASALEARLSAG